MDNSIFETERHYCQRFVFVTAWVFEALHYPTLPNEIKKTKLKIYTERQDGIDILLAAVGFRPLMLVKIFISRNG